MSETTEFKDVYEAIASVSPNRQNILYTVLEENSMTADRPQPPERNCSATA